MHSRQLAAIHDLAHRTVPQLYPRKFGWRADAAPADTDVAPVAPDAAPVAASNPVDGHEVPVPHFGIVLTLEDWQALADRLTAAGTARRRR